ncbi:MAG: 4-oxalocrotonate decarboxylase [Rhodoferax sp.]|nr:4-oxalocrotonate decarboxylase [Rhodoferax sp.]
MNARLSTLVDHFSERLDEAARTGHAVPQFTEEERFNVEEAYAIQAASIARRLRRGERRTGMKMGFTSRAKMVQMGVHDMIWGRLTDAMAEADGGTVALDRFVHPRVEPEIAFLLKKPLPANVSLAQAADAVLAIAPALEIIDSRYDNFRFSLTDVIADNASSSGYVIGPWADPARDTSNLGLVLSIDGLPRQIGSTAAILGHPLRSLVAAARLSAAAGEPLQAGWIVMAGGATAAEALAPGQHVRCEMQGLGHVEFHA